MAFAFVSIATGIFTTYGAVLNSSGPLGIWTWPVAVLGQLAVAFVIGALASRIPVTGYAYQWTSRLANPVLGWVIGWISFIGFLPWRPPPSGGGGNGTPADQGRDSRFAARADRRPPACHRKAHKIDRPRCEACPGR
ncbi:hypothetical protein [Dactylosporangium sp. NPDC048998]|uniref:hypothetical protein n=1 Tax=Dactylosporangium sp. NPDC048998 TaxID=3363976 RepID=UPI00371A8698